MSLATFLASALARQRMATRGVVGMSKIAAARASVFALGCVTGVAAHATQHGPAATYPTKPVRLILGPPAGGPTDGIVRMLAPRLSELWRQPVVIVNRPGAGNTIATDLVAKATPDGYTLLLCPLSDTVAPAMYSKLPYDFERDFRAVGKIGTTANVFVVHPSLPARSVKEFIAEVKARPGKLNYGAQGIGQSGHLSMELLKSMAGNIDIVYVNYKQAGDVTTDLLAGRIHAQITNLPAHVSNIQSGRLRALGVTTPKRDPRFPDVPAIAETLPGFDVTIWYGLCAPALVPVNVVSKISAVLAEALGTPELRARLEQAGVDAESSTPEQFAAFIRTEMVKWKKVVMTSGIAVQKPAD